MGASKYDGGFREHFNGLFYNQFKIRWFRFDVLNRRSGNRHQSCYYDSGWRYRADHFKCAKFSAQFPEMDSNTHKGEDQKSLIRNGTKDVNIIFFGYMKSI